MYLLILLVYPLLFYLRRRSTSLSKYLLFCSHYLCFHVVYKLVKITIWINDILLIYKLHVFIIFRNAFGPSSGTICLSGLLICIVRIVRSAVENVREQEGQGIIFQCLRCVVNTLLTAIEFLNKFTINFAAITGEAYCTSARMTYELLKRNLLSAVFVETVSTRLLSGIVFVLSAIYTIIVSKCILFSAKSFPLNHDIF